MTFSDHFSAQATAYAESRPHYPQPLYDHLLRLVGADAVVWEVWPAAVVRRQQTWPGGLAGSTPLRLPPPRWRMRRRWKASAIAAKPPSTAI